jgi:hypothetical protein
LVFGILPKGEKMKKLTLILAILVFSSCATVPPGIFTFESSKMYNKNFDVVWEKIIALFAEKNISIKTLEKSSGIVVAEDTSVPFNRVPGSTKIESNFCDCGAPGGFNYYRELQGRFNVFVRKVGTEQTSVQINTTYRASVFQGQAFIRWLDCNSKGFLEEKAFRYLDSQLE